MTDSLTLMRAACVSAPTCWQTSAVLFDVAKEAHGSDDAAEVEVWESVLAGIRARMLTAAVRIVQRQDTDPRAATVCDAIRLLAMGEIVQFPIDVVPGWQGAEVRQSRTRRMKPNEERAHAPDLLYLYPEQPGPVLVLKVRVVVGANDVLRLWTHWPEIPGLPLPAA